MIESLITSKTRLKLLLKFFLNSNTKAHLRMLSNEFNESTNSIRIELNRFEKAGLLNSEKDGNKKVFFANNKHPLYADIHNIVFKHIGIDKIIEEVIDKLGEIKEVYLTGDFANGLNSNIVDLVFIADLIDNNFLLKLIDKAERMIKRKIRYVIFKTSEANEYYSTAKSEDLILWSK